MCNLELAPTVSTSYFYKFIRDKIVWKLRVEKGSNEHINVSK